MQGDFLGRTFLYEKSFLVCDVLDFVIDTGKTPDASVNVIRRIRHKPLSNLIFSVFKVLWSISFSDYTTNTTTLYLSKTKGLFFLLIADM